MTRIKWMLLTSVGIILVSMCSLHWRAAEASGADNPSKPLRIAMSSDWGPYQFLDSDGKPAGLVIDLWKLWSKKNGVPITFIAAPWNESLKMVKDGRADIHAGLTPTEEIETYMDFGVEIAETTGHYFVHESVYYVDDVEELRGFVIGAPADEYETGVLRSRMPNAVIREFDGYESLFNALKNGEIRIFVFDTKPALFQLRNQKILNDFNYKIGEPLYRAGVKPGVAEGAAGLLNEVDRGFRKITSGEKAEIERRWLGRSLVNDDSALVIAACRDNKPFTYMDIDGRPAGFLVDLWRLWAGKAGRKVEFLFGDLKSTLDSVQDSRADIIAGIAITDSRAERFDFSHPFYEIAGNLFYPAEIGNVKSYQDFQGSAIGVLDSGYAGTWLGKKRPGILVEERPDIRDLLSASMGGEIAGFITDAVPVKIMLMESGLTGGFKHLDEPLYWISLHAAVKKNNAELMSVINGGLEALTANELMELEAKWIFDPKLRFFKPYDQGWELESKLRLTDEERDFLGKKREILMCVDPDMAPYEEIDKHGRHVGIIADYMALFSDYIGIPIRLVPTDSWEESLEYAKNGKCDIVSFINETPERGKYLAFTRPYKETPVVIVTKDNVPHVGDLQALEGKRVGVVKDCLTTSKGDEMKEILTITPMSSSADALKAVSEGKVFAALDSLYVVSTKINELGLNNLKISGQTGITRSYRIGVRKDEPILCSILDKAVGSIDPVEENEIMKRWASLRYEHGFDYRIAMHVAAISLFVIFFVILRSNRKLRVLNQKIKMYLGIIDKHVLSANTDGDWRITDVSEAFCDNTGYRREELIGRAPGFIESGNESSVSSNLQSTVQKGETWTGEIEDRKKDGSVYWTETIVTSSGLNGKDAGYMVIQHDITDKKTIQKISVTDQLTGLYNRRRLDEALASELDRARRYGVCFSVILFDIDKFKSVNDQYGHQAGDGVLIELSAIAQNTIRNTDIIGRWGGEEFLIICPGTNLEGAVNLAEKLRLSTEGHVFPAVDRLTASFGVSTFTQEDKAETIIRRVDDALYRAKKSGRNRVEAG